MSAKLKPNQFILSGHLFTEIPALFQTEMVRAICADRKTQTRRIVNGSDGFSPNFIEREFKAFSRYANPGDLIWVRETWANLNCDFPDADPFLVFKSDIEHPNQHGPVTWKPSIHMPKSAARIWLMVEDIRVERVQDISEADAIAEGIFEFDSTNPGHKGTCYGLYSGMFLSAKAKLTFALLWSAINGRDFWNSNPSVWVIRFKVLSKTGRPSNDLILENYRALNLNPSLSDGH